MKNLVNFKVIPIDPVIWFLYVDFHLVYMAIFTKFVFHLLFVIYRQCFMQHNFWSHHKQLFLEWNINKLLGCSRYEYYWNETNFWSILPHHKWQEHIYLRECSAGTSSTTGNFHISNLATKQSVVSWSYFEERGWLQLSSLDLVCGVSVSPWDLHWMFSYTNYSTKLRLHSLCGYLLLFGLLRLFVSQIWPILMAKPDVGATMWDVGAAKWGEVTIFRV